MFVQQLSKLIKLNIFPTYQPIALKVVRKLQTNIFLRLASYKKDSGQKQFYKQVHIEFD